MTTSSETSEIVYTHQIELYTIEKCGEFEPTWNEPTNISWKSLKKRDIGEYKVEASPNQGYPTTRANISVELPDEQAMCYKIKIINIEEETTTDITTTWPCYLEIDGSVGVEPDTYIESDTEIELEDIPTGYAETDDRKTDQVPQSKISIWNCCPSKKYIDKNTGYCATFLRTSTMYMELGDEEQECTEDAELIEYEGETPPRCVHDCPQNNSGWMSGTHWGCGQQAKLLRSISEGDYEAGGYVPAAVYGHNEIGNCCWPEDCEGIDSGINTSTSGGGGTLIEQPLPGTFLLHPSQLIEQNDDKFEIIENTNHVKRKTMPGFDILEVNFQNTLPMEWAEYEQTTGGEVIKQYLDTLPAPNFRINIKQHGYTQGKDWQILKIRFLGPDGNPVNVAWTEIDGVTQTPGNKTKAFQLVKETAKFHQVFNNKYWPRLEIPTKLAIRFTNNKVVLSDLEIISTTGFHLDPLGVGCFELLEGYEDTSPSPTSTVPEHYVMNNVNTDMASRMPLCTDPAEPVISASMSFNSPCGALIECSAPPPCEDKCTGLQSAEPCQEEPCPCIDVCTGEEKSSGDCETEPCNCSTPPPGAGCDPHINTFFNKSFEM